MQRNFVVLLETHSEVNVYNFVRMRSDLVFLSYVMQRATFSGHIVVSVGKILTKYYDNYYNFHCTENG